MTESAWRGDRMREARLAKGITGMTIARELNVDVSTVRRWETLGVTPTSQHVLNLAELLGVEPTYFFTPDGDEPTE